MKKHVLTYMLGVMLLFAGCQKSEQSTPKPTITPKVSPEQTAEATETAPATESPGATESPTATPEAYGKNQASLGGIKLGDSQASVKAALGSEFKTSTEEDTSGLIGEDLTVWTYDKGIAVYFGKKTGTVLRVISLSPDCKTELGVKVGDPASNVLEKYKSTYKEVTSRQSDKVLAGWFDTGNDIIVIFDFNKEDGSKVNESIDAQAPVQVITLGYWRHYD